MIRRCLPGFVVLLILPSLTGAADVGEFSIRPVVPLGVEQVERLRELVAGDAEASALAEEVRTEARPLFGATPQPLARIDYEGLVNTDAKRIATVAKLREMDDVAVLVRDWQVSGDPRAEETLRDFLTAWAATYRPTGNDVNENKLYPLLVAYHHLRGTFEPGDRERIDAWLRSLGELHARAVAESTHFSNRYTKHVRLLSLIGGILDENAWRRSAEEGLKRFVSASLRADGTSLDLETRDTLTYHASALRPVIELAMLSGEDGAGLYRWESPEGGSIAKSVDYLVPYAMGEKTREEWTNSRVDLDRRRAEAGLEEYRPGRLYDPRRSLSVMQEASYFNPDLERVVRHLLGADAGRFPSWQMLVNEAARDDAADR